MLGFQGVTKTVAESVLCDGGALEVSLHDYNWLGNGIYFWERDHSCDMLWAENKCARRVPVEQPAVVGAIIDLGNCLTLPIRVVYRCCDLPTIVLRRRVSLRSSTRTRICPGPGTGSGVARQDRDVPRARGRRRWCGPILGVAPR